MQNQFCQVCGTTVTVENEVKAPFLCSKVRCAEKLICQNVQIQRLPGNRTRMVSKDTE